MINTGVSTVRALQRAGSVLADEKILLTYLEANRLWRTVRHLREQEGGGHADEVETSMMLYMAPNVVNMAKAVKTTGGRGQDLLPMPGWQEQCSHPVAFGAMMRWHAKRGTDFTEALVDGMFADLDALYSA